MALVGAGAAPQTTSSNTSPHCRYHVFLSFRGQDTRKTFTDHLYTALNNAGFLTFRDDDELERGEEIKPGLQRAIQQSRTSVIVFSKDYASSRWCLDELVMILEHKRTSADHVVLPVFYDVDPSHVRKQTGSIAKAFARHQKTQSLNKVKGWREALEEVADLAGMVLQNQADGFESKFIKKIVKVIGNKLSRTPLSVAPNMIGMHSRVENINLWLQDGSTDVGILVIYGMSGIGKTTIAKFVYNSNFRRFEGSSFLENIREISYQPNGLVQIQRQLLYDILNGRKVKIHGVSEGIAKIEDVISSKRVLLVLDDVDHMDQLDALLRMKDQFYPGSKIIITTRRAKLLKAHQVTKVHKVRTLDYNESLELFSWNAFAKDHPVDGYMELSEKVVHHCGGLPLALQVLGSSLSGESIHAWKSALEKLEAIPNGEIMNKLRISYDSLQDEHDRQLFLHIASFFIGKDKDYIVRILDGCDFYTIVGIENLIDRCLVSIDKYDKVQMHDMVRDMGRGVVRLESEEPGERSRLWQHKDSFKVLREKNGTHKIEGLVLDMRMHPTNSPINSIESVFETNSFARMTKLKLLHLGHVQIGGYHAEFPPGLRWLCWLEFPLDSIPADFPLDSLIVLEMQYSSLRQVYKGTKCLPSLKILDLSHSNGLSETVDFSFCPNLEKLILVDCTGLTNIDSIGNLERLVYLNMKNCKNLRMLPEKMSMLKSLETLIISGCSNLNEFPVEMMKKMESQNFLQTNGVPIGQLCPERSLCMWRSLPCSLVALSLSGCNLTEDAFPKDFSILSSLQRLILDNNPICSLPNCIKDLTNLHELSFCDCTRLESLLGLPKVHELDIGDCTSLEKVTFDKYSSRFPEEIFVGSNDKLVEIEYYYKLEPIGRVDIEMIKRLGLCNLESMAPIQMYNWVRDSIRGDRRPVQGLYERGIFSTFLAGKEVPGQFSHKSRGSSSISLIVPPVLPNLRIRGFNIFAIYAISDGYNDDDSDDDDDNCMPHPMIAKVSNKSKGLKWIYGPLYNGIPGEGEDMIWLSHWKMEDPLLQPGDEVIVSVFMRPRFEVKECGFQLIVQAQEEEENNTQQHITTDPCYPCVIGGELSRFEYIPGIYFLCRINQETVDRMPIWLENLIGDADYSNNNNEDTGNEEGQQDGHTNEAKQGSINFCSRGCKLLIAAAAGFFFTLSFSLLASQKKKQQSISSR